MVECKKVKNFIKRKAAETNDKSYAIYQGPIS